MTTAPADRCRSAGAVDVLVAAVALAVASLEPGHPAAGVQDLLLARIERVAVGADLDVDRARRLRAAGGEGVATAADHFGGDVLRMDAALHRRFLSWAAGSTLQARRSREPEPGSMPIVPDRPAHPGQPRTVLGYSRGTRPAGTISRWSRGCSSGSASGTRCCSGSCGAGPAPVRWPAAGRALTVPGAA